MKGCTARLRGIAGMAPPRTEAEEGMTCGMETFVLWRRGVWRCGCMRVYVVVAQCAIRNVAARGPCDISVSVVIVVI